jgi:hypothetical protein
LIERIKKIFEFGLLLAKVGRDLAHLAHFLGQCTKHAYAPSPTMHNAFFSGKLEIKEKL